MIKEQSDQHTKTPFQTTQQKLAVAAITWNLYGSVPSAQAVDQLMLTDQLLEESDIIFIGTQECERSLFASFCLESKDQWELRLTESCPAHFLAVTETMRGLHLAVLVRKTFQEYFQLQRKQKLRAGGPCRLLGNKGAISIEFSMMGQAFQIINCHLAAHQGECARRNETIHDILENLIRRDIGCEVIFLGDLNYRIEMTKQEYQQLYVSRENTDAVQNYSAMVDKDQLFLQQELKDRFLNHFEEGTIDFPPTYKIGVDSGEYNKKRIPGWTDRIFSRKAGRLARKVYSCGYKIMGCDHRPVYARYELALDDNIMTFNSEQMVGVRSGQKCQLI